MVAFLLSPEARDLRPLLLAEAVEGFDLLARDRLRRAYSQLPSLLAPRLPLLGPLLLPGLPAPPLPVPGLGLVPARQFVDAVAPPLSRPEEVYLRSMSELGASALGAPPRRLSAGAAGMVLRALLQPGMRSGGLLVQHYFLWRVFCTV